MRGVILAGGLGTRLHPLTKATNKHLLPVGREPMLYHPVRQMVGAGITEILVVTSTQHMGEVVNCLGSGEEFACSLSYKVQETAGGIAHALRLAERFSGKEPICVILGDNYFQYSIAPYARAFEAQQRGARVLLKEVGDPERFGVAALDEQHVIDIEEKPRDPKSSFAVVGLYFYDHSVFDIVRGTELSERGELEITSVNNEYIARGELQYDICVGGWTDAGTFESYLEANVLASANQNRILPHES
jgi:glucose-1-phosphate thymidylyltransferase